MRGEPHITLGVDVGSHGVRLSCGAHVAAAAYAGPPPPARRDPAALTAAFETALSAIPRGVVEQVEAVAVTGVRGAFVALSRDGSPATPVIPDFDPGCIGQALRLREAHGNILREETGCPPFPLSGLPKILRLLEEGIAFDRILTPQDWIARLLTESPAMSAGAALRLGILNRAGDGLHEPLLADLGVPLSLFPPLVPIGAAMGLVRHPALPAGIPVVAAPGDGPAAHAAVAGDIRTTGLVSFGTTTVTLLPAPSRIASRHGVTHELDGFGGRLVEYGSGVGGVATDWLARLTGRAPGELEMLSRDADPAGLAATPAFLNAWGDAPGGAFTGLRPEHGPAEMAAATFDAIGDDAVAALSLLAGTTGRLPSRIVATGGGARSLRILFRLAEAFPGVIEPRDQDSLAARGAETVAQRHLIAGCP